MPTFFKKPAIVMIAALLAYAVIFYLLHALVGRGMTMVSVIPVVAASLVFRPVLGSCRGPAELCRQHRPVLCFRD